MTSRALNAYEKVAPAFTALVWFEGVGALSEGQALCYNWDTGTATARDARRQSRVELPTSLNAQYFAGVVKCALAADASRGTGAPALIEIYLPGSYCNILIAGNTVIGVETLTFDVTSSYQGVFRYEGLEGEGSADVLQTVTYASSTAELCYAKLQTGRPSGGVEVVPIVDNDAIGTLMFYGTTLVTGATIGAGDCTYTLADAVKVGTRKKFGVITTEIATNDLVITITSGVTDDVDDVSLDTVTFAGAATVVNTTATFSWDGAWSLDGKTEDVPVLAGS